MRRGIGVYSWPYFSVRFLLIFGLVWVSLGFSSCQMTPGVIIVGQDGKEFVARVEIADTPAERALGLKYRRELKEDRGMLFLFPSERIQSFWMKDTPLSLDLIFIGGHRRIVGIIHQATPFSTASLSVPVPSRYVLELRGGAARRQDIRIGYSVRFEGIAAESVRE